MKKLLAMILAVAMLLCSAALAEGVAVKLGNLRLLENGETVMDMTGMELVLAGAEADDAAGARIALVMNGEEMLSFNLGYAMAADTLVLTSSALKDAYTLGDVTAFVQQLTDMLSALGIDMNEGIESFNPFAMLGEEDMQILDEMSQALETAVSNGIQDGGEVELNGKTYSALVIDISAEDLQPILLGVAKVLDNHPEMLEQMGMEDLQESGIESIEALVEMAGLTLGVSGNIYVGEDFVADVTLALGMGDASEAFALNIYANVGETDGGENIDLAFGMNMDGEESKIAFSIFVGEDDGAWIPAVPETSVDIMTLIQDEEALQGVLEELMGALGELGLA